MRQGSLNGIECCFVHKAFFYFPAKTLRRFWRQQAHTRILNFKKTEFSAMIVASFIYSEMMLHLRK